MGTCPNDDGSEAKGGGPGEDCPSTTWPEDCERTFFKVDEDSNCVSLICKVAEDSTTDKSKSESESESESKCKPLTEDFANRVAGHGWMDCSWGIAGSCAYLTCPNDDGSEAKGGGPGGECPSTTWPEDCERTFFKVDEDSNCVSLICKDAEDSTTDKSKSKSESESESK